MIKVWYSDESVGEYKSIEEAREEALETVIGCNFAATIDAVKEFDDDGNVIRDLYCEWNLEIKVV